MSNDYNITNTKPKKNIDFNSYLNSTQKTSGEKELLFNYNADKKVSDKEILGFQRSNNNNTIEADELINKKIEKAKQGQLGDCWFIAQINALADTEFGAEIIKNAITINPDNTYTVKLKGADKEYTITKKELESARKEKDHASGDPDMLLLELVFEKYYQDETDKYIEEYNIILTPENIEKMKKDNPIEGGIYYRMASKGIFSQDITFILGGKDYTSYIYRNDSDIMNKLKEKALFPNDIFITFSTAYDIKSGELYKNGDGHALSIRNIQLDSNGNISKVDIIDPHDNSKVITKNIEDIMPLIDIIQISASKNKMNDLIEYEVNKSINNLDTNNSFNYSLLITATLQTHSQEYNKLFIENLGGIHEILNHYQKLLGEKNTPENDQKERMIFFLMDIFQQGDKTITKDLAEETLISSYCKELEDEKYIMPSEINEENNIEQELLNETFQKAFGYNITEFLNNPAQIEKICRQYGYMD